MQLPTQLLNYPGVDAMRIYNVALAIALANDAFVAGDPASQKHNPGMFFEGGQLQAFESDLAGWTYLLDQIAAWVNGADAHVQPEMHWSAIAGAFLGAGGAEYRLSIGDLWRGRLLSFLGVSAESTLHDYLEASPVVIVPPQDPTAQPQSRE